MSAGEQTLVVAATGETLARAREGDRSAFEALLQPLTEPGFRLALSMLADWHEAEDAVQDASVHAWRRIHQLRGDRQALRSWFLAIVANQCRRRRRLRWSSVVRSDELHILGDQRPVDISEDVSDLRQALRRLKPEDRSVLLLHYALDMPIEEVADVLGLRPAGARSRLYRALGKLRDHLDPSEVIGP
jgi:RNA polymerase sigma-70 factor (ECF subfamily)